MAFGLPHEEEQGARRLLGGITRNDGHVENGISYHQEAYS